MIVPASPPSPVLRRTIVLALISLILGFVVATVGIGQARFLWSAYHHGGL